MGIVPYFVLPLGKLFGPTLTTLLFYVLLAYTSFGFNVTDVVSPCVFVFLMAYLVSAMFSEVFGMTIDTVLQCYIADEEMFPLEQRFAEGGLKSSLQRTAQRHASKKTAPIGGKESKYAVDDDNRMTDAAPSESQKSDVAKKTINVHAAPIHHPEGDVLL